MVLVYPEEIQKLMRIVEPYEEGCHLREDAPPEIVEAKNKIIRWEVETEVANEPLLKEYYEKTLGIKL